MEDGESLLRLQYKLIHIIYITMQVKIYSKSLGKSKNNCVYNKFILDVIFESHKRIFNT